MCFFVLCWFWFIMAVMLLFAPAFDCRDALACDVTGCGFGPECGHALAEVLKTNTTLKDLYCVGECAVVRLRGLIVAIACSVLGSLPLTRFAQTTSLVLCSKSFCIILLRAMLNRYYSCLLFACLFMFHPT